MTKIAVQSSAVGFLGLIFQMPSKIPNKWNIIIQSLKMVGDYDPCKRFTIMYAFKCANATETIFYYC